MARNAFRAGALVTSSVLALGFIAVGSAEAAAPRTATHYYVDCAAGNDSAAGTTQTAPWRTLARASTVTFGPGDVISLKRGTACAEAFAPHGSGNAALPVTLNSYGSGAAPKIAPSGVRAAVYLHNVEGWELRDLDVSDAGGSAGPTRAGIYVQLTDFGTGHHYVVDNVHVHDVNGCDCTGYDEPSGGILFNVNGSATPTGFSGVHVTNSRVDGVNGLGISTSSQWAKRSPEFPGGAGSTYVAIPDILVSGNQLSNLGGDGIVIQNGVNAKVEHNVVDGYSLRAAEYHSGIWTWDSDNTVIQFNEIAHGGGSLPAEAFDVDGGDNSTIYQYNFTHDNNGGMALLCAVPGMVSKNAIVRYNISQNDAAGAGGVVTIACTPQVGAQFYNNVIYSPSAAKLIANSATTSVHFANNILVGAGAIDDPNGAYDHNLASGGVAAPAGSFNTAVSDPKLLHGGDATSIANLDGYKLATGSPALGTGVAITQDGGRDFYGNDTCYNNIGAYQGPGLAH